MVTWATFPANALTLTAGSPKTLRSSPGVRRELCGECGSALTYRRDDQPGSVDVTVATLDEPAALEPRGHIWTSHRLPWLRLDDDLPRAPEASVPADPRPAGGSNA
jgi:hypothetical protein